MITAITGHRADNIPDEKWTRNAMREALAEMAPESIIQGMAAGVDIWSAAESWHLNIPFHNARPWRTHNAGVKNRLAYEWVMKNAASIHHVSDAEQYPGAWIYKTRNIYMVDNAETVLAVWNGMPHGGTYHAFQYALEQGKKIYRINPAKKEVRGWIN